MKVSDVMSTQVDFVTTDTTVKDISRLIFGRGINGVPVCKGKKVVGFITERDILAKFFPSVEEYIEDPVHTVDFEEMEKKVADIFALSADKIMSRRPITIKEDALVLKAQSTMLLQKVGRLPVVDKKGNLTGIISKGDIFRGLVGAKLSLQESEEYNDWLSRHYFISLDWQKRLAKEIPDLVRLFRGEKVKNVLDIGCGIGMHSISLARRGFNIFAFDRSDLMLDEARKALSKEPKEVRSRVLFFSGEYEDLISKVYSQCDAAIFMGNSICHNPYNYEDIIKLTSDFLPKKALMIFQIRNYENIFKKKNRMSQFRFSKEKSNQEHAFIEYYDPPRGKEKVTLKTSAIFDFDGRRWKFYGLRNTLFAYMTKKTISEILKKYKFNKVSFFGGYHYHGFNDWDYLFRHKFDESECDWLNVIAKRG